MTVFGELSLPYSGAVFFVGSNFHKPSKKPTERIFKFCIARPLPTLPYHVSRWPTAQHSDFSPDLWPFYTFCWIEGFNLLIGRPLKDLANTI